MHTLHKIAIQPEVKELSKVPVMSETAVHPPTNDAVFSWPGEPRLCEMLTISPIIIYKQAKVDVQTAQLAASVP